MKNEMQGRDFALQGNTDDAGRRPNMNLKEAGKAHEHMMTMTECSNYMTSIKQH